VFEKSFSRRARQADCKWTSEFLECRLLLTGTSTPAEEDWPEDKETDQADMPAEVAGAFLTDVRYGDTRPMSFDDVFQGQQDSCVFASVLSATALSSFNLEGGIREVSRTASAITYGVRLYQNNSGTFTPIERQVVFDGTTTDEDYKPRNSKDYWPLIYQRAYIAYANSLPNQSYKSSNFAFQTLIGVSATSASLSNTLATAQAIRSALTSGQGTLAGTISSANLLLENTYGLIHNHAYSVLGVSIPSSGSLTDSKVTLRNPWGKDTNWSYFDANHDNVLSEAEYARKLKGIDGANDGIITVPWSVFSTYFGTWTHTNRTGTNINNIVKVDLPVQFTPSSLPVYQIYEGQRLEIPIKATDPEGRFVYYEIVRGSGYVNPQSGKFSWEPPANSSGYHYLTVSAETNPGDAQTLVFLVVVRSGSPVVTSLTASPTTIKDDGSDLLTLTATATTDIGRINDIQYWRDADGNGILDKTKDVWLGDSGRFYVSGLTPGQQTFFAQARRFSFSDEFFSFPRPITVNVVAAPKLAPIAIASGNQVQLANESASQVVAGLYGESYVRSGRTVRHLNSTGQILDTTTVAEAGATNVKIAFSPQGGLITVWVLGTTVKARREPGSVFFTQTLRTGITLNDNCLQIATDFYGNLMLVWHQGEYFQEDIWSMSVDMVSGNQPQVVRTPWRVNSFTTSMQKYPTVSMTTGGEGIIAWTDFEQGKTIARHFTEFGKSNGPEITIANSAMADKLIASAANDENGDTYVAWTQPDGVFFRRVLRDGRMPQAAIKANTFSGGQFFSPAIKVNRDGWLVVAWENTTQDGNANDFGGVFSQVFTPGGVKIGPEFPVPTTRTGTQGLIGLTFERNGKLLYVWSNGDYLSTSYSTSTRLFTVDFQPLIPFGQSFPVAAGTTAGTVIGTVKAYESNDGQAMTWALLNSPGFAISQSGELSLTTTATFASGPTIAVNVRVTTNGKSTDQTVTVSKSIPVELKATLLQPMDVRQIGTDFGEVVVANETHSVVGAPNTQFNNASGRVFVYDAANVLVRTIENPEPDIAATFGRTLAVSGNRLLVGASTVNGSNSNAYVFDLTSGALISSIHFNTSSIGVPSISGDLIVAPDETQRELRVYSALTGVFLRTISDPTQTIFGTKFGRSAVISGNTIARGLACSTQRTAQALHASTCLMPRRER
jgi:hypothetical protein